MDGGSHSKRGAKQRVSSIFFSVKLRSFRSLDIKI